MKRDTKLWPVTIVLARYGGCYEGGQWCAFNYYPDSCWIDGWDGDDGTCREWWDEHRDDQQVAVGESPEAALLALEAKNP